MPDSDLTLDLQQDLIHQFTLGWSKKTFIYFKNYILSAKSLDQMFQKFDIIIYLEGIQIKDNI